MNYAVGLNITAENQMNIKYESLMAVCTVAGENVHEGHLQCIEFLVNSGVKIAEKDRYGVNALMTACKNASTEIVETLLSKESSVNDVDNNGWSPLFYAANRGSLKIVSLLLKYGADVNLVDSRDRYPYTIASDKGFSEISLILKPKVILKSETQNDDDIMPMIIPKSVNFNEYDPHYHQESLALLSATAAEVKRYTSTFRENRICLRQLLLMKTEDQLRVTGIMFSFHRKTILKRIREFHMGSWSARSFGLFEKIDNLEQCDLLLSVLTFVTNLHRQLLVLRATFEYMKDDILNSDQVSCGMIDSIKSSRTCLLQIGLRLNHLRQRTVATQNNSPFFLYAQDV